MSRGNKPRDIFFVSFCVGYVNYSKDLLDQVSFTRRFFSFQSHIGNYLSGSVFLIWEWEVKNMTIIWGGTLAVILAKLRRKLFRVDKQRYSVEDQIKRIGVYYMCIDDLPIWSESHWRKKDRTFWLSGLLIMKYHLLMFPVDLTRRFCGYVRKVTLGLRLLKTEL